MPEKTAQIIGLILKLLIRIFGAVIGWKIYVFSLTEKHKGTIDLALVITVVGGALISTIISRVIIRDGGEGESFIIR